MSDFLLTAPRPRYGGKPVNPIAALHIQIIAHGMFLDSNDNLH